MFSEYYPYILEICKIFVPSLITFVATKHSILHPKKYSIREKQFTLVYLPLYLLTKKYNEDINSSDKSYIQKSSSIIYKNFQYVFTDTIELLDDIQPLIYNIKNEDDEMTLTTYIYFFCNNIKNNYFYLRKYLGYPTKSPLETFKRDHLKKNNFLIFFLFIGIPLSTVFFAIKTIYAFINNQNWYFAIPYLLTLSIDTLILITYWIPLLKTIIEILKE